MLTLPHGHRQYCNKHWHCIKGGSLIKRRFFMSKFSKCSPGILMHCIYSG